MTRAGVAVVGGAQLYSGNWRRPVWSKVGPKQASCRGLLTRLNNCRSKSRCLYVKVNSIDKDPLDMASLLCSVLKNAVLSSSPRIWLQA